MSATGWLSVFVLTWIVFIAVLLKNKNGKLKAIFGGLFLAIIIVLGGSFALGFYAGVNGKPQPNVVQQSTPVESDEEADKRVEQRLTEMVANAPRFVHQDGQEYGYEANSGEIIMVRYLGEKSGTYQFMVIDTADSFFVYSIAPPYKFVKATTFFDRRAMKKETFALDGSVIELALHDAKISKLKQYINRDKKTLWINDQFRIEYTPAVQSSI